MDPGGLSLGAQQGSLRGLHICAPSGLGLHKALLRWGTDPGGVVKVLP